MKAVCEINEQCFRMETFSIFGDRLSINEIIVSDSSNLKLICTKVEKQ